MKSMKKIALMVFLLNLCSFDVKSDDAPVKVSSVAVYEDGGIKFVFSIENVSNRKLLVSEIEVNDSPIVTMRPSGEVVEVSAIVDFFERRSPNFAPSARFENKTTPLEQMGGLAHEVGIYKFSLKTRVEGKEFGSQELIAFREQEAPRISIATGESVDSPRSVAEALKSDSFEFNQAYLRSLQIAATEGTKQFFFANPFTVALSVDGKPGLKVALFATNVERKPKQFPEANSESNYLEMKTPTGEVLRVNIGPVTKEGRQHGAPLAVGETMKRIGDVAGTLREEEITAPGTYVVTWVVEDTEVGSFTFVRPEPKAEVKPAAK